MYYYELECPNSCFLCEPLHFFCKQEVFKAGLMFNGNSISPLVMYSIKQKMYKLSVNFTAFRLLLVGLFIAAFGMPIHQTAAQDKTAELPVWFRSGHNKVHGVGIVRNTPYDNRKNLEVAFSRAIEDMNANSSTILFSETFDTGYYPQTFNEFSIGDQAGPDEVVTVDTVYKDGVIYLLAENKSGRMLTDENISMLKKRINKPNYQGHVNIEQAGPFYLVTDSSAYSKYKPNASWIKARQNALERLGHYYSIEVHKLIHTLNTNFSSFTYAKSKVLFNNILVVSRRLKNNYAYITLAVREDHIISMDDLIESVKK